MTHFVLPCPPRVLMSWHPTGACRRHGVLLWLLAVVVCAGQPTFFAAGKITDYQFCVLTYRLSRPGITLNSNVSRQALLENQVAPVRKFHLCIFSNTRHG